jgi:hypothetical protein
VADRDDGTGGVEEGADKWGPWLSKRGGTRR